MQVADIISRLGGSRAVAKAVGCPTKNVWPWGKNGVPAKHWPALVAEAQKQGASEITFDLLAAIHKAAPNRPRRKVVEVLQPSAV